MNKVHYSSKRKDWETPKDLFDKINMSYNFTLDVCASKQNSKCKRYIDKKANGLLLPWQGEICWMNPPYGREIKQWIKKAYIECQKGATIVALLPARTDTSWFHDFIYNHNFIEIEFLRGRIKFVGAKYSAPFPSMIVTFWNQ